MLQDNTFKFQTIFEIRMIHYSPNSVKSDIFTIILCVVLYRAAYYLSWLDKHSKHRSCTFFGMQYFKSHLAVTVTPYLTTTKHTTHIFTLISCCTNLSYYLALPITSDLISPIMSLWHRMNLQYWQHFLDKSLALCAANIFIYNTHQKRFP
jgi:hypothetical protein